MREDVIISVTTMSTAARESNLVWTDFHSHCLPDLDDGAADVKTAVEMLRASEEQGVTRVVATPHFYIGEHSAVAFFRERQRAYEQIKPYLTDEMPEVLLGAEVLIREGISRYDVSGFCLQGTNILLVELPFMAPPYWVMEELEGLAHGQGLTLMLAHLDRYLSWYSRDQLEALLDLPGVIVQVNADSVADKQGFRYVSKHLPLADRMVLGSDMHNLNHRAPRIGQAVKAMSKQRTGRQWLDRVAWTTDYLDCQDDNTEGLL